MFAVLRSQNYRTFDVSTFSMVSEPPSYFKKEVKQSSEMNYEELRRYIHDLQQSGFDVVRLRVQLQKKFAYPHHHAGHGDSGRSVCAVCRQARCDRRSSDCGRNCRRLLDRVRPVRSDGKHQPASARIGRVVPRPDIRVYWRVLDSPSSHLESRTTSQRPPKAELASSTSSAQDPKLRSRAQCGKRRTWTLPGSARTHKTHRP